MEISKAARPIIEKLAQELKAPVDDVAKVAARLIDDSGHLDEGEARRALILHQNNKNEIGSASEQELLAAFETSVNTEHAGRKQLYGELIAANHGHSAHGRSAYSDVVRYAQTLNTAGINVSVTEVADAYKRFRAVDNSCHHAAAEALQPIVALLKETPDLGVSFGDLVGHTEAALSHALPAVKPNMRIKDEDDRMDDLRNDLGDRAYAIAELFEPTVKLAHERNIPIREAIAQIPAAVEAERGDVFDASTTLIEWLRTW